MSVSIIVGGQFGSEGKGKVALSMVRKTKATIAARVGGPNSGHTVYNEGKKYIFKMLPTAAVLKTVDCVLTSGSYIDVDILLKEIEASNLPEEKLKIDPFATIITDEIKYIENHSGRRDLIGSTNSGTGAAVSFRVQRNKNILLAKDDKRLQKFITPVKPFFRKALERNAHIILEGTQGFGLSVLHTELYPYATSRDTSAAGFLSEAGLSPFDVENVVMVIRAFPIRVPGNSGPLKNEIDWEVLSEEMGAEQPIIEYTSVTKSVRRVARFDPEIVCKAIEVNNPNIIVLNHLDYIDGSICGETLTEKTKTFINSVEESINRKIDYIGLDRNDIVKI